MRRALVLGLAAGAVLASSALAQVPPDVEGQLQTIGRVVETARTAAIYTPLQPPKPANVAFERDIAYGADPKEMLDVAHPAGAKGAPVLIYIHGGAYVGGDKTRNAKGEPSAFSDNIMVWATTNGMVGVNMNYPLAPGAPYPAAQQDIGKVVAWVQANIGRYGGDPRHVFLWGHSAGASHVATYVGHPEFYPGKDSGLSGAIMTSGTYDMTVGPQRSNPYFGDPSTFAQRQAMPGLLKTKVPLFIATAELDPQAMNDQQALAHDALCAQGRCSAGGMMKGESHMSESYSVGTADQTVSAPVLAFVRAH